MKALYKMEFDCGRMGTLYGVFVADTRVVAEAMGKTVNFGEALGKHSEVYGVLEDKDVILVTKDEEFIAKVIEYDLESGYNPLHHIQEE